MTPISASLPALRRIQFVSLILGLMALAISALGLVFQPRQFFSDYLFSWFFWAGLSFGCLIVTMIHHLTGGRWGYPTRRFLEAGFMVLPLMAVLFIPVVVGLKYIYPWAQSAAVAVDPLLQGRRPYVSPWAFVIRALIFFASTIWMAFYLRRVSLEQDTTEKAQPSRQARTLSGPGVVFFALIATFVYVDWIMSLERRFFSTMFPVILLIGQVLVAYCFSVLMVTVFRRFDPFATIVSKTHYHHLGNLLLAFVLFWTYISFGQLLIVYAGDLPPEVDWYLHRIAGSWKIVVAALATFHFFVPFFLLLFRGIKKHVTALSIIAGAIFVMHIVDAYWLVMPSLHPAGVSLSWLDFLTPIGIGGLWLSFFLNHLRGAALLPQEDPGIQFAFVYGH